MKYSLDHPCVRENLHIWVQKCMVIKAYRFLSNAGSQMQESVKGLLQTL